MHVSIVGICAFKFKGLECNCCSFLVKSWKQSYIYFVWLINKSQNSFKNSTTKVSLVASRN